MECCVGAQPGSRTTSHDVRTAVKRRRLVRRTEPASLGGYERHSWIEGLKRGDLGRGGGGEVQEERAGFESVMEVCVGLRMRSPAGHRKWSRRVLTAKSPSPATAESFLARRKPWLEHCTPSCQHLDMAGSRGFGGGVRPAVP